MPDPAKPFSKRRSDPNGVGPYQFKVGDDFGNGALASGETATLDLREFEQNGTVGYYTVLSESGYDSLLVENLDGSNSVSIEINEVWTLPVPNNTIQTMSQNGMYRFSVTNQGGTAISVGDIVLTIQKEPYGADSQARDRLHEHPLRGFVRAQLGV